VLTFLPKRGALPIKKLLESAVANAKDVSVENLVVMNVTVNKGLVMKRSMPRARGSAFPINKRTSHVLITLKEKGETVKKEAKKEVVAKKVAVKKAAVKKVAKKVTK
jgi:large subunit ribosomal protein L22